VIHGNSVQLAVPSGHDQKEPRTSRSPPTNARWRCACRAWLSAPVSNDVLAW